MKSKMTAWDMFVKISSSLESVLMLLLSYSYSDSATLATILKTMCAHEVAEIKA